MDRVVLDTNVFVSGTAIFSQHSASSQIIDAWRTDTFTLITSPEILAEVQEVFLRPKIMQLTGLRGEEIKVFLAAIRKRAYVTEGTYEVWKITNDPDDNIFLACALEGYATHIVTSDKESLLPLKEYHGVRIVTPSDYLASLH